MSSEISREYTRLNKEMRPLAAPFLAAGGAIFAMPWIDGLIFDGDGRFGAWLAMVTLIVSCCFVAALAYGLEYRDRTLPLLLSQPLSRTRGWFEKTFIVVAIAVVLSAVCLMMTAGQVSRPSNRDLLEDLEVSAVLVVVSIGAAAFWSAFARSTIGTFAFTIATLFGVLVAGASWSVSASILGIAVGVCLAAGACWRHTRAEAPGSSRSVFEAFTSSSQRHLVDDRFGALWIGRRSPLWNFVAKELRLQRSGLLILLVFAGLIAALDLLTALGMIQPSPRNTEFLLKAAQIVGALLLAVVCGCSAICEEKALGTANLNFCLPRRSGFLFAAKFTVSVAVFAALVVLLQLVFVPSAALGLFRSEVVPTFWLAVMFDGVRLNDFSKLLLDPALLLFGLFVFSFWISTLAKDSGQAALLAIPAFLACAGMVSYGWRAAANVPPSPLDGLLLQSWSLESQMATRTPMVFAGDSAARVIAALVMSLMFGAILVLSRANVRIAQPRPARLLLQLILIAGGMMFVGTVVRLLEDAPRRVANQEGKVAYDLRRQLDRAIVTIIQRDAGEGWRIRPDLRLSFQELVATRQLDDETVARYSDGRYRFAVNGGTLQTMSRRGDVRHYNWYAVQVTPAIPVAGNRYFQPTLQNWEVRAPTPVGAR